MTISTTSRGSINATAGARRPTNSTHHADVVTDECCDVPAPPVRVEPPDDDTLAKLAKAMGHPARVKILRLLAARNACITSEVVDGLFLAHPTVSAHLRVLREAGLIQGEDRRPTHPLLHQQHPTGSLQAGIITL